MTITVTGDPRSASCCMRVIASAVLAAFLSLTLQPLALAANLPAAPKAPAPRAASNDEKLAKTLEDIEDQLEKLEKKLTQKADTQKEKDELRSLRQSLDILDRLAITDLDKIGRHL